jgi:hypothetical protein
VLGLVGKRSDYKGGKKNSESTKRHLHHAVRVLHATDDCIGARREGAAAVLAIDALARRDKVLLREVERRAADRTSGFLMDHLF